MTRSSGRTARPGAARLVVAAEMMGTLAAALYLKRHDPRDPRAWMPVCPVKLVTHLDCPACGGLRLVHDVLNGRIRAAADDNPFLLLCAPLLIFMTWRHWRAILNDEEMKMAPGIWPVVAGAAFAWMIVRNVHQPRANRRATAWTVLESAHPHRSPLAA